MCGKMAIPSEDRGALALPGGDGREVSPVDILIGICDTLLLLFTLKPHLYCHFGCVVC